MCPVNDLGCYFSHIFDKGVESPLAAALVLIGLAILIWSVANAVNTWWTGRNKNAETMNEGNIYTTLSSQTNHLIKMTEALNRSEDSRADEARRHSESENVISERLKDTADNLKQVAIALQSIVTLTTGLPDAIHAKTQPQIDAVVNSVNALAEQIKALIEKVEKIEPPTRPPQS